MATAWATYQAAHWRSEQGLAGNRSIAARVEANRVAGVANRQIQIDVASFFQWVDAYSHGDKKLAAFYFRRFRPEFRPAVAAWIATKPLVNPKAPLTPFVDARVSTWRRWRRRMRSSGRVMPGRWKRSRTSSRADRYTLCVVLFALALFCAGISTRLHTCRHQARRRRRGLDRITRRRHLDGDLPGQLRALATDWRFLKVVP